MHEKLHFKKRYIWDFHGSPVAETSPSKAWEGVWVTQLPGQGVKIPHASRLKNHPPKKISNTVANSTKILKMVHILKNLKK